MSSELSLSVGELRRNIKQKKAQVRVAEIRVTDEDAQYIAQDLAANAGVEYLRVEEAQLSAAGAAHIADALARGCTLKVLLLGRNAIGDEGALAIAAALTKPGAAALTRLSLAHNAITNVGATALCDAAKAVPSLISIDLHGNPVDSALLDAIESVVDRNGNLLV